MESLPELVDAAAREIAEAKTAAEILQAKEKIDVLYDAAKRKLRIEKAKGSRDSVLDHSRRTVGHCLELSTQAEVRLVEELDRAREAGQMAKRGGQPKMNVPSVEHSSDEPEKAPTRPKDFWDEQAEEAARKKATAATETAKNRKKVAEKKAQVEALPPPATLTEVGLTAKEIHNARMAVDAERIKPGVVSEVVEKIIKSGDEPTKAALRRELNALTKPMRAANAAEKKAKRKTKEQQLGAKMKAENERLGKKLYAVVYMDPPWKHEPWGEETGMDRAADNHYPTMTFDEIRKAAPPTTKEAVLFLWVKRNNLEDGISLIVQWGFAYKTCMVWVKEGRIGNGYWCRDNAELLLIATKGKKIPAPAPGEQPVAALTLPKGEHSVKPEEFRDIIHGMYPSLPKLEMYARSDHPGFDSWGAES